PPIQLPAFLLQKRVLFRQRPRAAVRRENRRRLPVPEGGPWTRRLIRIAGPQAQKPGEGSGLYLPVLTPGMAPQRRPRTPDFQKYGLGRKGFLQRPTPLLLLVAPMLPGHYWPAGFRLRFLRLSLPKGE